VLRQPLVRPANSTCSISLHTMSTWIICFSRLIKAEREICHLEAGGRGARLGWSRGSYSPGQWRWHQLQHRPQWTGDRTCRTRKEQGTIMSILCGMKWPTCILGYCIILPCGYSLQSWVQICIPLEHLLHIGVTWGALKTFWCPGSSQTNGI
jgi:hypothetical protein